MTELNSRFIATLIAIALFSGCATKGAQQVDMRAQYDDILITTQVHDAILDEPALRPFDINVRTTKGVVELSGIVNSRDDMDRAISIARSIRGIKFIRNDMRTPGTGDYN